MAAYPKLRCAAGNVVSATGLTTAGTLIVPPAADRTIRVVGGWMRALAGTVTTAASVNISDSSSTNEVMVGTAANMTAGLILREGTTGMTCTKLGTALTKGDGLLIKGVGATVTVATSVDYCVYYTVEGG
jgi:hypothetical protein